MRGKSEILTIQRCEKPDYTLGWVWEAIETGDYGGEYNVAYARTKRGAEKKARKVLQRRKRNRTDATRIALIPLTPVTDARVANLQEST